MRLEIGIVLAIGVLILVIIFTCVHEEKVVMPTAYAAWVKQTGNTGQLSYEEWRALKRADRKDDTTIIFVPH